MRRADSILFAGGSISWAVAQWVLVWTFARFAGGAEAVGEYSTVIAVATPVFVVGQFGLRSVYLTLWERSPWRSYFYLRLVGITAAAIALSVVYLLTDAGNPYLWAAVLALKSADALVDILYARLQRVGSLGRIGVLSLVNSSLTVVAAFVFVGLFESVSLAVAGSAAISLLIAFSLGIRLAHQRRPSGANGSPGAGYRRILGASLPTTIAEAVAAFSAYLPIQFLALIADEGTVGVFTTAAYLLTFANIVGSILKNIAITPYRRVFEKDGRGRLYVHAGRTALVMLGFGVLMAPLVVLLGGDVLSWIYGAAFELDYLELALLAGAAIPLAPTYLIGATLSVLNAFTGQAWVWVVSAGFGLVAGYTLLVGFGTTPMVAAIAISFATGWTRLIGSCALMFRTRRGF